jgi:hypothetical protein
MILALRAGLQKVIVKKQKGKHWLNLKDQWLLKQALSACALAG